MATEGTSASASSATNSNTGCVHGSLVAFAIRAVSPPVAMNSLQQKHFMGQVALLEQGAIRPETEGDDGATPSLLTLIGFGLLTFNSGMAVYQWNRAMGATSFVGFSFLDIALLFYCLRLYIRALPGSLRREHLKMAVWLLTMMLTYSAFILLEFWLSDMRQNRANIS